MRQNLTTRIPCEGDLGVPTEARAEVGVRVERSASIDPDVTGLPVSGCRAGRRAQMQTYGIGVRAVVTTLAADFVAEALARGSAQAFSPARQSGG